MLALGAADDLSADDPWHQDWPSARAPRPIVRQVEALDSERAQALGRHTSGTLWQAVSGDGIELRRQTTAEYKADSPGGMSPEMRSPGVI